MIAKITFRQLNPDYDKKYAKQYYHGRIAMVTVKIIGVKHYAYMVM